MYTKAVGTKFHPDGTFRHFPGNTVISMCVDVEPLFSELVWAQEGRSGDAEELPGRAGTRHGHSLS